MAERTSGLHRLVTIPAVYAAIQSFLGTPNGRQHVADILFSDLKGKNVLEVGCGPGGWAPYLTHAACYTGIDWNPRHIETAEAKYSGPSVRFICGDLSNSELTADIGVIDAVVGIGILHHLDDSIARELLQRIASMMTPCGRYIGIEPVLHTGQNPVARLLKALDSGQNIRREPAYRALFGAEYTHVDTVIRTDLMRLPYSHCLVTGTVA